MSNAKRIAIQGSLSLVVILSAIIWFIVSNTSPDNKLYSDTFNAMMNEGAILCISPSAEGACTEIQFLDTSENSGGRIYTVIRGNSGIVGFNQRFVWRNGAHCRRFGDYTFSYLDPESEYLFADNPRYFNINDQFVITGRSDVFFLDLDRNQRITLSSLNDLRHLRPNARVRPAYYDCQSYYRAEEGSGYDLVRYDELSPANQSPEYITILPPETKFVRLLVQAGAGGGT